MPRVAARCFKARTGVLASEAHPSSSKIGGNDLIRGGTWSTQIVTKKKPTKGSSVLKGDHIFAMMDSLMTGAGLTSDLNTPEIKFEDFDFKGKAINNYNDNNMEVESSLGVFEPAAANVSSSNDEDSLSTDAPTCAAYSLFDMSPGCRDVLRADQHEQRINIQELLKESDDVATYTSCISSIPNAELDFGLAIPQTAPETLAVTGLGATALAQPAQLMKMPQPYNSPPQLSINSDDFTFSIPQDMLEQMESLFPEEPIIANPVPANDLSSTELDMYLGTHDLLSESMKMHGLLDHELEAFNFEDKNDLSTVDAEAILLPSDMVTFQESNCLPKAIVQPVYPLSNAIVEPVNPLPCPSTCVITDPITINCPDQSLLVTPTTSTFGAYPKTPAKKRHWPEDVTPTTSAAGKRQRRAAKKPLRFREPDAVVELIDSESNDGAVADRLGIEALFGTIGGKVIEIKDEDEDPDVPSTSTGSRQGGKNISQNLTEEQKYHRIRVLNNEASKRCRQKRKMTMKEMGSELEVLAERNKVLKKKSQDLEKLKGRLQTFVNDFFRKRLGSSQVKSE